MNKRYTVLIRKIHNNEITYQEHVTGMQNVYSLQDRLLSALDDNIYMADFVEGWKI